ncbi:riboflavin synthase alpha chain [Lachnotalea glycerini]|uniref:Riboflavin synthase n=1 Tax=Lachnotalea glycerini TaxID=1763509 RepID=A0A318EQ85_9FIRM|nr:riboflavin synthase [Lachnotalea glycerini]PXV91754.1 riboflavin synthase alpha chain [Lachnotalea glycerini]
MFTGIIEETGSIRSIMRGKQSVTITILADIILEDLHLGDSVAVNGICLTVTEILGRTFTAYVMHETLTRCELSKLVIGRLVNLERAMPANGRFGGHIVSGHIDGTGQIVDMVKDEKAIWYTIKTGSKIMKYVVEKGSIAIDGISLTIAKANQDSFCVSVIPHTAKNTSLSYKMVGDMVNLENDILGKYIEQLLKNKSKQDTGSNITKDFLNKFGY